MTQKHKKVIKIFICYAYDLSKDRELLERLEKHLKSLRPKGKTISWYIRAISRGKERVRELDTHLYTADIILLLLSQDFVSSDYCYNEQIQQALKRHQSGEARIIPIIIYPVALQNSLLNKLTLLPKNGEPISNCLDRDEALLDVIKEVRQVIEEVDTNSTYNQELQKSKKKAEKLAIEQMLYKDHMYYQMYKYRFPTIDFKFQNTGTATAFLWQFAINILQAEVDPTPVLEFKAQIKQEVLEIVAINQGWGIAHFCHITIEEPILNSLFSEADRTFTGTVSDGKEQVILSFTKKYAIPEQFEAITKELTNITHQYPKIIRGINLKTIQVKWTCEDKKGTKHEGIERIPSFDWNGDFILTHDGFFKTDNPRMGGGAPSDVIYSTIIDPLKGPHERLYPISRQIPANDIERFHIMVGSPMSCHLLVQFKLYIDSEQVITTGPFEINIRNPQNSNWHYGYRDGDELKRDIDEQQEFVSLYKSNENNELQQEVLEYLERLASIYPFVSEQYSPYDIFSRSNQKRKWFFE